MVLSDVTIKQYIAAKKIQIFPEFDFLNIRPTGIRLHLGKEILIPKNNQTLDLAGNEGAKFDSLDIPAYGFMLKPGDFILASSYERILVPRNIVCQLEGRSTVARLGLSIHCTSGIIDGNFEEPRSIVYEIKNNGPLSLMLKEKLAVAMLIFYELSSPIEQKSQNQYKGQSGVTPPNLTIQKQ